MALKITAPSVKKQAKALAREREIADIDRHNYIIMVAFYAGNHVVMSNVRCTGCGDVAGVHFGDDEIITEELASTRRCIQRRKHVIENARITYERAHPQDALHAHPRSLARERALAAKTQYHLQNVEILRAVQRQEAQSMSPTAAQRFMCACGHVAVNHDNGNAATAPSTSSLIRKGCRGSSPSMPCKCERGYNEAVRDARADAEAE